MYIKKDKHLNFYAPCIRIKKEPININYYIVFRSINFSVNKLIVSMTAVVALDGISNFKQTLPATSPYISLELVPKANTAKIEDDKGFAFLILYKMCQPKFYLFL